MRIHRFYIGDTLPSGQLFVIDNTELIHQWKNVFRMKIGAEVILFDDNKIEYLAKLISIDKKSAQFEIIEKNIGAVADKEIILCAALIKKDNFEIIIQKAVELGVTSIIPIISERSEKKFLNSDRANKIIIEAVEQCGRVDIPSLEAPISFENALTTISNLKDVKIIGFEPKGEPFNTKVFASSKIALFIGPEGGWTDSEIEKMKKVGTVMNIPTFVLRSETAAISAMTIAKVMA